MTASSRAMTLQVRYRDKVLESYRLSTAASIGAAMTSTWDKKLLSLT